MAISPGQATINPEQAAIERLAETVALQRAAFAAEVWPTLDVRRERLTALAGMLLRNKDRIREAVRADFGVHPTPFTDVVEILNPVGRALHAAAQLDEWAADDVRQLDPAMFGSAAATSRYAPKGVVGNMVPWNFPFEIGFGPLAEILAAGNRVVIKPSELTPACAELIADMVAAAFDRDLIDVVVGGVEVAKAFAAAPWDHLLYTGNPEVGREVALAAAANLVPVTLELGGKSPAVLLPGAVDEAAVKNVLGTKMIKNGQVCVTVDHVLVPRGELDRFVELATSWVRSTVPDFASSPDCAGIISERHLDRLVALLEEAEKAGATVHTLGGDVVDRATRQMPLSLVLDPDPGLAIMREEVFGPILPVVPYDGVDDAVARINAGERPLALYVFGDVAQAEEVVRATISGGVGINACAMQANNAVGFGGTGRSGYGRHHGVEGFREFSVQRGAFVRGTGDLVDAFLPPYSGTVEALVAASYDALEPVAQAGSTGVTR